MTKKWIEDEFDIQGEKAHVVLNNLKDIVDKYGEDIEFYVEYEGTNVFFERYETDYEYETRLKREKEATDRARERDYAQYLKLKNQFEGDDE